jgi:hypothetical protein
LKKGAKEKNAQDKEAIIEELQSKLKNTEDLLKTKQNQLQALEELKADQKQLNEHNLSFPLVSKSHMEMIHDDETKKLASAAHKTIKTLNEVIAMKNSQLQRKEDIIEGLKKDIKFNQQDHLNKVQALQNQINA